MASPRWDWRRFEHPALIVLASYIAVLAVLIVPPWIKAIEFPWSTRQVLIAALVGLEFAYVGAVGAALLGVLVFGHGIYRAHRRRSAGPMVARGLLLCGFGLVAFAMAEGVAAAWRAWTHRIPALTLGDPEFPGRFAEATGPDEVTLTVLGGSSAEGMPYNPKLSIGAILAWQLERAIPGRRFRLDLLARAGTDLAVQYRRLASVRRRPDVLIVYSGHNEFSAGIPWSRRMKHYDDERPAPGTASRRRRRGCPRSAG